MDISQPGFARRFLPSSCPCCATNGRAWCLNRKPAVHPERSTRRCSPRRWGWGTPLKKRATPGEKSSPKTGAVRQALRGAVVLPRVHLSITTGRSVWWSFEPRITQHRAGWQQFHPVRSRKILGVRGACPRFPMPLNVREHDQAERTPSASRDGEEALRCLGQRIPKSHHPSAQSAPSQPQATCRPPTSHLQATCTSQTTVS